MLGKYISQPAMIVDPDYKKRVILPAGYLTLEEAQDDLVPYIVVVSNGNGFSLRFDSDLVPSSSRKALALKDLSELSLQLALRKAAKIIRNAMREIGITELVPVPAIGFSLSLEVQAVMERDPSSYRQVLESVFLLEAIVSYGFLDREKIGRFLEGMFKSYPWDFAPSTTLRVPTWASSCKRSLRTRVIVGEFFSTIIPWSQVSFLEVLRQGDPCVLIRNEEGAELAKAYFYFEGKLVLEKTVKFSTAVEIAKRFVRENLV